MLVTPSGLEHVWRGFATVALPHPSSSPIYRHRPVLHFPNVKLGGEIIEAHPEIRSIYIDHHNSAKPLGGGEEAGPSDPPSKCVSFPLPEHLKIKPLPRAHHVSKFSFVQAYVFQEELISTDGKNHPLFCPTLFSGIPLFTSDTTYFPPSNPVSKLASNQFLRESTRLSGIFPPVRFSDSSVTPSPPSIPLPTAQRLA